MTEKIEYIKCDNYISVVAVKSPIITLKRHSYDVKLLLNYTYPLLRTMLFVNENVQDF